MNKWLESLTPQTIAVIRALPGLGDFLCFTPALRTLRAAFPEASTTLIGLPQTRPILQRFSHYVDTLLEFPGYPGIPEVPLNPTAITSFLNEVQRSPFDLALQMHGNGSCMNGFVLLLGAKQNAGFYAAHHYCPDPDSFLTYQDHESEVKRHLRLLNVLGTQTQGEQLEFPLLQADWQQLQEIIQTHGLSAGDYVCIHPGASVRSRQWAYQRFASVADALAAQGLQIVLTGTAAELKLATAVAETMKFSAINLAGQTNLGSLAALLKKSQLLICNDTGVSHLADALDVKSVIIFSDSDPRRWAPLDRDRHRVIQISGKPNFNSSQTTLFNQCSISESVSVVLAEVTHLLQREFAYAS